MDVLLGLEPNASRVRERIGREDSEGLGRASSAAALHVPHLFEVEVLHTLRRLALSRSIPEDRCLRATRALSSTRLARYSHAPFVKRIWELRANLSAYDAAYVALAETLEAPLLTTDGRLARAPGHNAEIEFHG